MTPGRCNLGRELSYFTYSRDYEARVSSYQELDIFET